MRELLWRNAFPLSAIVPLCPKCKTPMVERYSKNDTAKADPFWGCSNFPQMLDNALNRTSTRCRFCADRNQRAHADGCGETTGSQEFAETPAATTTTSAAVGGIA